MGTYLKTRNGKIYRIVGENSSDEKYICVEYKHGKTSSEKKEIHYDDVVVIDSNVFWCVNFNSSEYPVHSSFYNG